MIKRRWKASIEIRVWTADFDRWSAAHRRYCADRLAKLGAAHVARLPHKSFEDWLVRYVDVPTATKTKARR